MVKGLTPICPKCGSVNVSIVGGAGECREFDCKHVGSAGAFKNHTFSSRQPNQHWRDPVALSMDGYD